VKYVCRAPFSEVISGMNRWYLNLILKKLLLPFFMIALLLFTGTAGYMLIEHYTLLEAIYMTVITIASIGYNEVKPLSDNGRIYHFSCCA